MTTGFKIMQDGIDRIMMAMREGKFTREELEVVLKWFQKAAEITQKTLDKGGCDHKEPIDAE